MSARLTRRHRLAAGGLVVAAAAASFAVASAADGGSRAAPVEPSATAPVTRQDLVAVTTVDGTLRYAGSSTVLSRRAGTLTSLAPLGSTVREGEVLFRVDGRPVLLMRGSVPAYRRLAVGTRGRDVRQLEQGLAALGFDGFTVDDEFTTATRRAVLAWQEKVGLAETGVVELGDVVFAAGALRVRGHAADLGAVVAPGSPVLETTGTRRVVDVDLDVDQQASVRVGAAVKVRIPGGGTTPGRITTVGTVASAPAEGSQGASNPTIDVQVELDRPRAAGTLDEAPVEVELVSERREDVLTVPVVALLALAEGGYGVEVVEGRSHRVVAVEVGMFADGRVEVSGADLAAGMKVEVPSS